MSGHTTLPWEAPVPPLDQRFDPGVYSAERKQRIASCFGPRAHAVENAAHIVRCVNAYDDMRAALMKAREDQEEFGHLTKWAVDLIEAALAKAIAS